MQKPHNAKPGKSGFTLVELCVVLALLAILTTMIVSFSVLMNGFAAENKNEYKFIQNCSILKNELKEWSANTDTADSVFVVGTDGTLSVEQNGTEKSVSFTEGILTLDSIQISNLDTIDGIAFYTNNSLIKCVIYRYNDNGEREENIFVFLIRCGTIQIEEVAENE